MSKIEKEEKNAKGKVYEKRTDRYKHEKKPEKKKKREKDAVAAASEKSGDVFTGAAPGHSEQALSRLERGKSSSSQAMMNGNAFAGVSSIKEDEPADHAKSDVSKEAMPLPQTGDQLAPQTGEQDADRATEESLEKKTVPADAEQEVSPAHETQTQADRLEALLVEQAKVNSRLERSSRVRTAIMAGVLAFVVGGFIYLQSMFHNVTKDIPELVQQTTELAEMTKNELNDIIGNMQGIDFAAINRSVEGLSSIDYSLLNESIQELSRSVEPFAEFMGMLSGGVVQSTDQSGTQQGE